MSAPKTTTTQRTLLCLGAGLLVLTVVTGWSTWSAFTRAYGIVGDTRDRTVPAITEVSAARTALVLADRAATSSFYTDAARFGGPGEEYRNQLAVATQNLTRAAEDNVTGEPGSRTLRLVQGQLASYTSSIEQAAAVYRQDEESPLWVTDIWNASQLLHAEDGVLAELDGLQQSQRERLDAELDSGGMVRSGLSWLVPAVLLLGLLAVAQVYVTRRFRRVVNPGLLAATLCLIALVGVAALTFDAYRHLASVHSTVQEAGDDSSRQAAAADEHGQQVLAALMTHRCGAGCGYTVEAFVRAHPSVRGSPGDLGSGRSAADAARITGDIADADAYRNLGFLVPLGALLVLAPTAAGLYFHIDRYRYRAR